MNPDLIVLGGPLAQAWAGQGALRLTDENPVAEALNTYTPLAAALGRLNIEVGTLEPAAGGRGAAAAVLDENIVSFLPERARPSVVKVSKASDAPDG